MSIDRVEVEMTLIENNCRVVYLSNRQCYRPWYTPPRCQYQGI